MYVDNLWITVALMWIFCEKTGKIMFPVLWISLRPVEKKPG